MSNYILKNENATYYECGFSCDNSLFLSLGSEKFFITDGRYTLEAKEKIKRGVEVVEANDLIKVAREILRKAKIKRVIFDPFDFTKYDYDKLTKGLKVYFKEKINFSQKKRIIKSREEIKKIEEAVKNGEKAFLEFSKYLSNLKEPKNELFLNYKAKEILTNFGENELSFEPIIAIDENSAKPHSLPTPKRLEKNSLILVDAGVKYQKYCSDRTRTALFTKNISFEKKQKFKNQKIQKIYDIVLKAQERAIESIRIGMRAKEIDKIAREVIEKSGFGDFFIHSTGHGVGLDIHELPRISTKDETIIEEGMVFTIEPGIYLPNEFGIRIEDMVVVESNGVRIL